MEEEKEDEGDTLADGGVVDGCGRGGGSPEFAGGAGAGQPDGEDDEAPLLENGHLPSFSNLPPHFLISTYMYTPLAHCT